MNDLTRYNKIHISEPFRPRRTEFLELWEPPGWRIKVYGIGYSDRPSPVLIASAKSVAQSRLRRAPAGHYGVGFLGVHAGRTANFAFIDWWADENELHHHVFIASLDRPHELEEPAGMGQSACVWDLRLIAFERDAWVETMLVDPAHPDLEGYLARRLHEVPAELADSARATSR